MEPHKLIKLKTDTDQYLSKITTTQLVVHAHIQAPLTSNAISLVALLDENWQLASQNNFYDILFNELLFFCRAHLSNQTQSFVWESEGTILTSFFLLLSQCSWY